MGDAGISSMNPNHYSPLPMTGYTPAVGRTKRAMEYRELVRIAGKKVTRAYG